MKYLRSGTSYRLWTWKLICNLNSFHNAISPQLRGRVCWAPTKSSCCGSLFLNHALLGSSLVPGCAWRQQSLTRFESTINKLCSLPKKIDKFGWNTVAVYLVMFEVSYMWMLLASDCASVSIQFECIDDASSQVPSAPQPQKLSFYSWIARFLNDGKALVFSHLAVLYNFHVGSGIDTTMHKVSPN